MRSINKQPKQIGYIFSVYKNDGDRHTNLVDHLNMITHLKLNSIPHQEVELPLQVSRGFYLQVDENNTKEELGLSPTLYNIISLNCRTIDTKRST